jgi:hypothetical protein
MADEIIIETTSQEVIEVSSPGPQGPRGADGAGLTTLTTTGDLLYRNATEPTRLPVGSNGQVLKVSGGLPSWGNESGAVTSVNSQTGVVSLGENNLNFATSSSQTLTASSLTLAAQRNHTYRIYITNSGTYDIFLPTSGNQTGDIINVVVSGASSAVVAIIKTTIFGPTNISLANITRSGSYSARWSGGGWGKLISPVRFANAPSANNSPGQQGEIAYDAAYLYTCVADNTWVRVPIANWPTT